MKVSSTGGPGRVGGVGGARRGGGEPSAPASLPARPIGEVLSIQGIPEAELTPKVRAAVGHLMAEVALLRGELERAKARLAELESLADLDGLLPLLNRRAFVRELSRVISFAERYRVQAALLYFDLDGFKAINDRHGHGAGDEALRVIAELLRRNVRESDVVGRLGGDEFGVILAAASEEQARRKADSLAALIAATEIGFGPARFRLSASVGVTSFDKGDAESALAEADQAMYAAKRAARGR